MVWVYTDPLKKEELELQSYLEKSLKKRSFSLKILKLLSLFNYLRSKKFKTAKELQEDVLLNKETPLFDTKSATQVFKSLYTKRGGGEYPFTESLLEGMGGFLKRNDPIGIVWLFEDGMWIVTLPVRAIKGVFGEGAYDLLSGAAHGLIETSVSGINGLAESAGGPVGVGAVILFTGIAAAAGSTHAAAEGDFSQAVVHFINVIPGIGPALVKGVNKAEHLAATVDKHREQLENYPGGEYITSLVPRKLKEEKTGGSRRRTKRKKRTIY